MTIRYSNGPAVEAMALTQGQVEGQDEGQDELRVIVAGEGDVRTFRRIHGIWISEEGDPVSVQFAWERAAAMKTPDEQDCVCPKELASQLIAMMLAGDDSGMCVRNDAFVLPAQTYGLRTSAVS